MGTSTSNSGAKSGVPFEPDWLGPNKDSTIAIPVIAPPSRYGPARSQLGSYLKDGNRDDLRKAVKSTVSRGMGGASRAASTMRGVAAGIGHFGEFLQAAREKSNPDINGWVDRAKSANMSASDLSLELLKEVMPDTGSIDEESLRNACAEALSTLYEHYPDVDIFNLTDQQIAEVMGFTLANEICNRIDLQLGQTYEKLKYSPAVIQERRNDIREWVGAEVQTIIEQSSSAPLNPGDLAESVLKSALEIFEE